MISTERPAFSDLRPGDVIDGFRLVERMHVGGMAHLWRATRDDMSPPAILKAPIIQDGDDATAIVSFEMEQMILPLLQGPHAPRFIASGDFTQQPFIVMELIDGESLLSRVDHAPLPVEEVVEIGGGVARALADLHSQNVDSSRHQALQHHAAADRRVRADRFWPVASRPAAGPAGRGIPPAARHRPLSVARADPARSRRSAQRYFRARRGPVLIC